MFHLALASGISPDRPSTAPWLWPWPRRRLAPLALALLTSAGPAAAQWSRVDALPAANVFCVVVEGDTIVAGGQTAVFVSTDDGTTWRPSAPLAPAVTSIQAVRLHQGRLFAGTFGQGVFVSDDLGATWTAFNEGLTGGLLDSQLFISSFEIAGGNLFAGTFGAGVYARSLVGPSRWAHFGEVFEPEQASNVNTLALGGTRLLAGAGGNGTVFHRDPGDADWTPSGLGPNGMLPGVQTQALLWTGNGWVAGTSVGVFLSPSGQEPWSLSSLGVVPLRSSAFTMFGATLVAAFDLATEAVIAFSPDEGVSWNLLERQPGVFVFALAADDVDVYAARGDGLWRRRAVELPHLRALSQPHIGTTWTVDVFAPEGAVVFVAASPTPDNGTPTPFGPLGIDLPSATMLGTVIAPPGPDPVVNVSTPVPNSPLLVGLTFWVQSLAVPPVLPARLSNTLAVVVQ